MTLREILLINMRLGTVPALLMTLVVRRARRAKYLLNISVLELATCFQQSKKFASP